MKLQMMIGILLLTVSATDVDISDQCTCEKLLSQADCKSLKGCNWFASTNLCSKLDLGTSSQEGFCGLINDATTCAKTKGCAYIDSVCQIFAGCTAYKGATDAECQAISKFCNSDGEAFCVDPGVCSTYKIQEDCIAKGSSAGSGTCIWDSGCRDQKCSEADPTFNTDAQCNNFIEKCVTTGKGCSSTLGLCSTYSGDIESCEGLKGLDGYCKGVDGKNKCEVKACTDADTTLITDVACYKFQIGCVTNGYGCVKSPLGLCSSLTGDDVICANKIGSDGKCKGITEGKTCSAVDCKDALDTYQTNDECKKFKIGCVTTGKGCTSSLGNCSSYKGTSTTCDGYIGFDGKCKGVSDVETQCLVKVCQDAEATLDTHAKCDEYQIGCKTTGKGCVSTLQNCSSYTGDSQSCDGYIGIDGKCTGGNSSVSCYPKKCQDAPTTYITNKECSDYQTLCIATGIGGCMDAGTCSTLSNKSQCDGKSTCLWTPQCVKNVVCADLKSESLCKIVLLQDNKSCWWINSTCIERTCEQAPTTYDSDEKCNQFLNGCLTKKKGCLPSTATCSSYEGTKTTCEGFTIKCTNIDSATETSACKDPVCSDKTNGTSDEACKSFYYGCVTNGTECVSISAACNTYPGTSTEICAKFKGNNKETPCWWKSDSKCVDRVCTDADETHTTDEKCISFLNGCITTGAGCVKSSDDCGTYTGLNQTSCLTLSTGCSRREKCTAQLTCVEITNATSQANCDEVLPNQCIFIKNSCVIIGNCNTYPGTSVDECKDLLNSVGQKCYWTTSNKCTDRECIQIKNPQSLKTCTDHKSTCAKRIDGTECQEFSCNLVGTPNPATEATCQLYHTECHFGYTSGQAVCTIGLACNSYGPSNVASCSTLIALNGQICKSGDKELDNCQSSVCSNFNNDTDCKAAKVALTASNQKPGTNQFQLCFYDQSNSCVERTCNNAKQHLGGTVSSFEQCNKYFEQCVLSKPKTGSICIDGYIDPNKFGCKQVEGTQDDCLTLKGKYKLTETIYEYRLCQKHDKVDVSNCVDRTCDQKTDGHTDAICQTWLPTCKTNGVSCIDISTQCTSLEGTSDSCKLLTGIVIGSKCQGNISVKGVCVARRCQDNGIAKSDEDCKKFLKGCITTGKGCVDEKTPCSAQYGNQDLCKLLSGNSKSCWSLSLTIKGQCIDRTCSHNTTAKTNDECETFMKGCVTKHPGCIESTADCTSYQGIQVDCEKLIGNGKTCTNDATATATSNCKAKDCTKLISDTYSQSVCQTYGVQCHYNGSKCDIAQSCQSLKGNLVTCTQYVATDGPCIGTALQTETPTNCSSAKCKDAPVTLITDAQCDTYKKGCKTNGSGCSLSVTCADVQSSSICSAMKSDDNFICTWASQCRDIESSCNNFTSGGSSVCTTSKTTSGFGICVWKDSVCTEAKCEDLPLSLSSETDCTTYSTTCTFGGTGNGCATKGACTTYTKKEICSNAKSTDTIGTCTWDESVVTGTQIKGCRVKECQDAATTLINDSECNTFIEGCVSNGAGCMQSKFTCDMLKTQAQCLKDSYLRPCLWINNACTQYYNCTDLTLTTIASCQAISKYCTTDENKCTPLKICANYTKQIQCIIGTDGPCGWVTSTKKCQLFTQCTDLISKVNTECSAYNLKCISNGTNCIEKGECSTYADSEDACSIGGIDGNCIIDKDKSICRLRQCSDSSTSISTHNGCFGYQINATTKCTTDESKCIPLADCQQYTKQVSCVIDSQIKACIWDNMTKTCKTRTCSDTKKTKSSECASALVGCISDGIKCIDKGKCSDYSTKEACSAGGTDGICVFTPASGSATNGACKLFTQCSDANSDQTACQSIPLTCKWTVTTGTTPSSCVNHTCDSAAKGTAKCIPIPSFDGKKYAICQPQGGKCVIGDPNALTQDNCYKMSQYTYSWNAQTKKCIACRAGSTLNNNSSSVNNSLDNTTNPTTDEYGPYLYALPILISLIF